MLDGVYPDITKNERLILITNILKSTAVVINFHCFKCEKDGAVFKQFNVVKSSQIRII